MIPEWRRLEDLVDRHSPGSFAAELAADAPAPVRRYLTAAIAPGTPLAGAVRLTMRGSIKIGRWLPFRARQLLAPRLGTVWQARVAGVISGSDRYVAGSGGMDWKLLGLRRLVHAEGPDVSRSAAERAAGESIWAPTAILPGRGAAWTVTADDQVRVQFDVDGHGVTLDHRIDPDGRLLTSRFQRWGDPDGTGTWAQHPFGVEVERRATFAGVTIPSRGRAGWHFGTARWDDGVFFRYEITSYELLA